MDILIIALGTIFLGFMGVAISLFQRDAKTQPQKTPFPQTGINSQRLDYKKQFVLGPDMKDFFK